jgi:hypothetical protein
MVKTYAVIENGVVVNVALAEAEYAAEQGWVLLPPYVLSGWLYDGQNFSAPTDTAPTHQEQEAKRAEAYRNEADPLFFQAQRGKATEAEWLDKIAEIEARFPYSEV